MHRMRLCLQEEKGLERTGQDRGGEKEKKEIEKKKGRRGETEKEQWGREGARRGRGRLQLKNHCVIQIIKDLYFMCTC